MTEEIRQEVNIFKNFSYETKLECLRTMCRADLLKIFDEKTSRNERDMDDIRAIMNRKDRDYETRDSFTNLIG